MATIRIPGGSTLSGLARQYQTTVSELLQLNPAIVDPNRIQAGAELTLPDVPQVQAPQQPQRELRSVAEFLQPVGGAEQLRGVAGAPLAAPRIAPTALAEAPMRPPSVVTSAPAREQVRRDQADLQAELERIKQSALTIQEQVRRLPEPTPLVPPQVKPQQQPPEQPLVPEAPEVPSFERERVFIEERAAREAEEVRRNFESLRASQTAANQGLMDQIRGSYDKQINEMREINRARQAAITQAGVRAGRARYAPEIEIQNISNEVAQGLGRIGELEAQKNNLIAQAQRASEDRDFALLSESMGAARQINERRDQEVRNLFNQTIELEKETRTKARELRQSLREDFDMQIKATNALAVGLLAQLTGDEEQDAELIRDFSSQYGLDPNLLLSKTQELDAQRKKYPSGDIGEYQFYADQEREAGRTPLTFETYEARKVTRKPPAIDKLSISEANQIGLPRALVGKSQDQIFDQLRLDVPPVWFEELVERELEEVLPAVELRSRWNGFRQKVLGVPAPKTTAKAPFDFGVLNLPEPVK